MLTSVAWTYYTITDVISYDISLLQNKGSRHNKMEKADILEMTVRHLRQIQRNQFTG